MKIMNIGKIFLLGMALLLILTIMNSCMARPKVVMYTSPYPAKDRDAQIDIYRTNKPTKEYLEIAEISCGDANNNWNMEQIILKAKQIGADGIIIAGSSGFELVRVPTGGTKAWYGVTTEYGLKATAIKYK
jgi:hypothetical protein